MARSATLNPASMPFFPGGSMRVSDEELSGDFGPGPISRIQHDRMSTALSISPTEYRSVKSSPSPSLSSSEKQPPNSILLDSLRNSPPFYSAEGTKRQQLAEARTPRDTSRTSSLEPFAEGQDTPLATNNEDNVPNQPTFFTLQQQGRLSTPPVSISANSSSFRSNGALVASSPSSSLDSGSNYAAYVDHVSHTFDAQLRSSPLIQEILDRLVTCEMTTREIHRDLLDVNRKVNILVERTLAATSNNQQPEFKDPFASKVNAPVFNTPSLSVSRSSVSAGIAPHQIAPSDDISAISQRLNTLTSSVGQLLAIQTQQMQGGSSLLANNRMLNTSPMDMAPHQAMNAPSVQATQAMLGLGMPNRPEVRPSPRVPNPPMRTWSAGAIDVPLRPGDTQAQRPDSRLLDKRRSVSGLLRRDSVAVVELTVDNGGTSGRDSGPVISKWEQLSLAPELLRSLNKFGIGPPNKIQQRALPFLLKGSDIIAQAPPTQERIAAYVIPAIQTAVANMQIHGQIRGPIVIMISTTVDQATQAQRMIRDLGSPIGVKSALGVGAASANTDLSQELRQLHQNMPHIICGTPQKLHALFTAAGGISGSEVRFLVLDEVDQLIARNLHDFVFNIVKLLPPPRSRPPGSSTPNPLAPPSSFNMDTNGTLPSQGRRFSNISLTPSLNDSSSSIERQTALFSNTVPQDVLNLASAIQLREPVRVLVRRDGNVTQTDSSQGSRGLRQFYLYLAFTAGGRADPGASTPGGGLGIIGSGRGASSSAESAQAREWKLDALADLFDDVEVSQAVVHVGGMTALDSVVYKLASRGLDAVPLHGDMNANNKVAALSKFRNTSSHGMRQPSAKVLVVYDVQVKTSDVSHVPLIINYDLPKAVEEYAHRVAPAIASGYARAGVVINFVTATGGDVEMLRSIECFYKIKCPEVPMSLRDIV